MKRHITLTLDADAIEKAKEQNLNISQELNERLIELTGGSRSPSSAKIELLEREKAELLKRLEGVQEERREEIRLADFEKRLDPYREYYKKHTGKSWDNRDAWLRETAQQLGLSLEELVRKMKENP